MIYLDIDDVMLTYADKASDPFNAPRHRMAVLNRICHYTKAPIVLSSDWRKGDTGMAFLKAHNLWDRSQYLLRGTDWHTPVRLSDLDDDLSVRGRNVQRGIGEFRIVTCLFI